MVKLIHPPCARTIGILHAVAPEVVCVTASCCTVRVLDIGVPVRTPQADTHYLCFLSERVVYVKTPRIKDASEKQSSSAILLSCPAAHIRRLEGRGMM